MGITQRFYREEDLRIQQTPVEYIDTTQIIPMQEYG